MKLITLLLGFALIQLISCTTISLEEGDSTTMRTFKWILDPASPEFPVPRFLVQDGIDSPYHNFRFLGTLNCSALPAGAVGMAIYDPTIDDWNCTSTGALPNQTFVVVNSSTNGLPLNCSQDLTAVWNASLGEWGCSSRPSLLFQSVPVAGGLCRSGDLLTTNYETQQEGPFYAYPAGLCATPDTRQVGPNAAVTLGTKKRNLGDPDEAFVVQSTSKAIGGLGSTGGSVHFGWQYWEWSPMRSQFVGSVGTYPPILYASGLHLVAVTSSTYSFSTSTSVWTAANYAVNFRVVTIRNQITGTYPSITYLQYNVTDLTSTIVAPAVTVYSNTTSVIPNVTLSAGTGLSIRVLSIPPGLTGSPKNVWFAVSLWISQIVAETTTV